MELEQIIRQIYRVPIIKNDGISIKINGMEYEVLNLGSEGIGIRAGEPVPFAVGDPSHEVELRIEQYLLGCKGKVVHVTPHGGDHYLCGIKLTDLDEAGREKLLACVYRIRANLFVKE